MRDPIEKAALEVLRRAGPDGWTMDAVAAAAGCSKGLVHYHHGTREDLLRRVAERLAEERAAGLRGALRGEGAAALDRLWARLCDEVATGDCRARLWLASAAPELGSASAPTAKHQDDFAAAVGAALAIPPPPADVVRFLLAAFDGLQLAMLTGVPRSRLRDSYHRCWLNAI